MEWIDDAIILSARRHGESSVLVTLLTREHGRHAGLVRGGAGRGQRGVLQTGMVVRARWRARLSEHLGNLTCEPLSSAAAAVMSDPLRLAALAAACAVAEATLPERQPSPRIFEGLNVFIRSLTSEAWPVIYVKWELGLLGELGFGLDLTRCAATGRNDQLAYVSPKSGTAVSLSAGEPYRKVLLPLPPFLLPDEGAMPNAKEIGAGLELTAYFLERHVFSARGGMPPARQRLAERIRALANGH